MISVVNFVLTLRKFLKPWTLNRKRVSHKGRRVTVKAFLYEAPPASCIRDDRDVS